ncbi:MAG: copper chaperone PCu(A)C [Deltaproteobacteria bacterium]|nr:copper chaperone PCu(A)C [Deltaproteobacteria bacterium]
MKRKILLMAAIAAFSATASADCDLKTKVEFTEPRIFAPLKGSNATGGFAKIKNNCAEELELVFKSADGFKAVESHATVEENGRMAMKKTDSFKIKTGETLELVPGGKHLMFFDPQTEIKEGSEVKLTFTFNKKELSVPFKVIPRIKK